MLPNLVHVASVTFCQTDTRNVVITREERLSDVYVVAIANGKSRAPQAQPNDDLDYGGASFSRVEIRNPRAASSLEGFLGPAGIGDIIAISINGTLDDLCRILEAGLDRPVVNETNRQGRFEFEVKASQSDDNDFLERLRDQFNLSITPAERRVQVVVLTPR